MDFSYHTLPKQLCYIRLVDMGGRQAKPAFLIPSKKPQEGTSVASAASPRRHSAFINTSDFLANLECTVAMAKTHELLRWITNMNVVQYCQPIPTTQHIFSLEASFLHLLSSSSSSFLHCPPHTDPKISQIKIPFPPKIMTATVLTRIGGKCVERMINKREVLRILRHTLHPIKR